MRFSSSVCAATALHALSAAAQCWQNVSCSSITTAAFSGAWDDYNYSPATRSVAPQYVLAWPGLASSAYKQSTELSGNGSRTTFDFGKEVGGIISFDYTSSGAGRLGVAFTEAKDFVGEWSDSSNGKFVGPDGYLSVSFNGSEAQRYVMPQDRLRGGFRYLTVFLETNSSASASVSNVLTELDFQPTWPNLRAYQGYFHSSDDLLNKIWYAGAYTLQSNSVPTNTGRQVPFVSTGWANNATLGPGDTVIVDGAKRDRAVWPGDMGVAVPSTFVSLGDLESVKNALQAMYTYQNADGSFPEAGPPLLQQGSDTYHMWSMVGTFNYFLFTNDTLFLHSNWPKYLKAMSYIYSKVDTTGLLNVTGTRNWARLQQGFHNTEANIILYHTLETGASLASWQGNFSLAELYTDRAANLRAAINAQTWSPTTGSYKDNDTTTTLRPQDANSLSLLYSVPSSNSTASYNGTFASKIQAIAAALVKNWTPIGPETPELPNNISPFISSFELLGRFTQRDTARALELLRTTWGWYQNNPNGTQSTVIEGYLTNGSFGYRNYRGYSYDTSYVSHSHGWSSGPTSGLTNFVVGLDVTAPSGSEWTLAPQPGDLDFAEAGFTTPLGKFQAKWTKVSGGPLRLTWSTPFDTSGTVTLPAAQGCAVKIANARRTDYTESYSPFGERLVSFAVPGGNGSATVDLSVW